MADLIEVRKKIILLGDGGVGKTSLIRRFVVDKFNDKYIVTIGSKVTAKELQITLDEEMFYLKLQIWDILGQKGYTKLHNSTFRGTKGAFMVADITRESTLDSLENYWIPKVQNIVGELPFVILGNKSDLSKKAKFSKEVLKEFASKYGVPFFLTSAKNGDNVAEAFYLLGKRMLRFDGAMPPKPQKRRLIEVEKSETVALIDRIINDFCEGYGRLVDAMPVLRRQFELANLDINNPTEEGIIRLVERLAVVEADFKEKQIAEANHTKRLRWLKEIKPNN